MIPAKLYIPTSTLNFNNIMSSESISPAAFYAKRQFGYRRFEKVEPNHLDNRLILYNKYPLFNLNDKEFENYPVIIEIDTNSVNEDTIFEYKNGVYYSEKTIYLNPFTTKVYFRNNAEKRSTLSKAEPSIETKMVSIYSDCFYVKDDFIESFEWKKCELEDIKTDISKQISKDRKTNKLKGFLFAYILASNNSISSEIVALKKYAKELRNTLSSIFTSLDSKATYKQEEQLKKLYYLINTAFYKTNDLNIKLQELITKKQESYNCNNFHEILQGEGLYDVWIQKQNIKPEFQIQPFLILNKIKPEEKDKVFEQYFSCLGNAINRIAFPTMIQKMQFPVLQHYSRIEFIPAQKEFLIKLFNEFLDEAYNCDDFLQSRYDFAKSGGKIFREEIQEKWEGSEIQKYINSLLKNLNEYTPFEINSTENLTLKSFAAFCQKGEDNTFKLQDYLISNEIGDFRIAYALWGIVFGFANMPKTITNDLFMNKDLNYVSEVYKYIYKQVHGITLDGIIVKKSDNYVPKTTSIINYEKLKPQSNELITNLQINPEEIQIRKRIKTILKKEDQIESIILLWQRNHFIINEVFFSTVSKIKGIGKTTTEKLRTSLQPNQQISENRYESKLLFDNENKPAKEFHKDVCAFEFLENLLPDEKKIRKQFKEDLKWFQDNYKELYYDKKKGQQQGYYYGNPTDNPSVIEKFRSNLENKQNSKKVKTDWLQKIYQRINITLIISRLKTLYV